MKKISLLFATLVMIMLFSLTAGAASESDLTFKLNADGNSYYVADCDESAEGALVIPSTYNGKAVTSIGNYAFYCCESLTSIEIPDSVTSIGYWAFGDCYSLTSIEIPDSVTSIGEVAFRYCYSLTSIEIPDSVTSIGDFAFCYCTGLTSIEIPDSVTSIGKSAFSSCYSLTSIEIPDSVTSIGDEAFFYCTGLTSITVDKNNQYYCNDDYGALYDKNKTVLIQYPVGNTRTAYTIPDSVTSIGDWAFFNCESLTSIEIPDSVTSIGNHAFSWCKSLTSIEIPDSVTSIGVEAFRDCDSLTSIEIPDSVTSIGEGAFYFCTGLTSIEIPDSVTSIGDYAFYYCIRLTSIEIPDSVTSIGVEAFYDCLSLTDVYYGGIKAQWNEISIGANNERLTNATIHFPFCSHENTAPCPQQDATCTEVGYTSGTYCSDCETWISGREEIPSFGHSYEKVVTAPTCEGEGYTLYVCECGDSYAGDKTPATGHDYDGDICKNCNKSKADNCSCNCHKGGFSGFIWKILSFFYKLFRINPVCDCGTAHY